MSYTISDVIYFAKNGLVSLLQECFLKPRSQTTIDKAFRAAAFYSNTNTVKFLIEKGANIHSKREYALRLSLYHQNLELAKTLLELGADIHCDKNICFKTAIDNNHLNTAFFLLENGADIKIAKQYAPEFTSYWLKQQDATILAQKLDEQLISQPYHHKHKI